MFKNLVTEKLISVTQSANRDNENTTRAHTQVTKANPTGDGKKVSVPSNEDRTDERIDSLEERFLLSDFFRVISSRKNLV